MNPVKYSDSNALYFVLGSTTIVVSVKDVNPPETQLLPHIYLSIRYIYENVNSFSWLLALQFVTEGLKTMCGIIEETIKVQNIYLKTCFYI